VLVGSGVVLSLVVAACVQGLIPRWYHSFRLSRDAGYLEQLLDAEKGTPADEALEAWLRAPAGRRAATELFVDLLVHDFEPYWKPQSKTLERIRIGVIGVGDLSHWRDEDEISFDHHVYAFRWNDERKTRLGNIPMSSLVVARRRPRRSARVASRSADLDRTLSWPRVRDRDDGRRAKAILDVSTGSERADRVRYVGAAAHSRRAASWKQRTLGEPAVTQTVAR
jgi:hypothetical protein